MKELFSSILTFAEWVSFAIDYSAYRHCVKFVVNVLLWSLVWVRTALGGPNRRSQVLVERCSQCALALLIGQPAAVIDLFFGQSTYNISEAYSSTGTKASLQVFKSFDTVGIESKWTQTESQRMRLG
ncbi:hypothetical protein T01_8260 [Trichinella spiralis]|uniref:Uncharacterized protein n=1 Tax=Trichinella spiralis TaxID=6334 RepID=A0A0V1BMC8_TRISP|nr:hypothetical protein T01_8260 [Trichinella spiralis]